MMNFEQVENTFRTLRTEYGIDDNFLYGKAEGENSFNIPFDRIFEKLNIQVIFENNLLDQNRKAISGRSEIVENSRRIFVNKDENPQRKKFTLCHELYYVLNNQKTSDFNEMCANSFAAEFLMPKDILKKKFRDFNQSVWMTADYFGVSWEAMGYRLINCGLSR